jgi:hypothetical protein
VDDLTLRENHQLNSRNIKEIEMNIIFQYSAKFVCGKSDGKVVAPGEYWTAINVHRARQKITYSIFS